MEGEEAIKQTPCIEIETTKTENGEDVQVYYLNVPETEDGQVLDISNILAQEGIQIVEADGFSECGTDSQSKTFPQSIILETDGSLAIDQSATQSAQALLNLSKSHSQAQAAEGIILDVNQMATEETLETEQVQLSEPVTATYVVDENGTMVSLNEYRDTQVAGFLEVEDPNIQTVAVCTCWCGSEFFSQEALDKHKLIHSKRRLRGSAQLKCELCPEVYNTSSKLANHHRVMHPDGMPWECPICFRRFSKKLGLKVHLRAHSGLKQHKCSYCERSFSYKNALLRHIRLHTKDKPYKCTICGENFAHMWAMRRHRAIHKPKHLFQCDICSKTFKQKQTLFIHARVHTGHKPYTCEICRKSFTLKSSVNQHLRIHTGERPKVCPICQKAFRQTSTLKSHMKLHSHLKPHKCRYCKKRFSLQEEMVEHENVHLSNKSWQCEECGMRFRNQSLLSRHIRKHTNERPFQCKICGKSFSQSGSLQSHMRTHTKEKPYQCRLCPKMYTTSGTLLLHIRRAHNLEAKSVKDVFPSTHFVEDQKIFTIPTPVSALRNNITVSTPINADSGSEKEMAEVLSKEGLVFEEVIGASPDDVLESEDGSVIIQRINPLVKESSVENQDEEHEVESGLKDEEDKKSGANDEESEKAKHGKKLSVKELMSKRQIKPGSLTLMNVDSLGQYKVIDTEKENSLYAQARQEAALGLAELSLVGGVVVSEKKSGTAYRTLARGVEGDASDDPSVTKIILSKEGGIMNSQDPHQCPECKRIFGRKSIMVEHRRIHTDEKPYKCDYCMAGFRQSAQLTCHIRNKHTKEKRYQCTFCEKRFLSHGITVRHINFHHKLKVRVCESMCPGWKVEDAIFVEKKEKGEESAILEEKFVSSKDAKRGTMKYGKKSNITILNSLKCLGSPTVKVKFGPEKRKVTLRSSNTNTLADEGTDEGSADDQQGVMAVQEVEAGEEFVVDQLEENKGDVAGTWYVCENCAMQFSSMDSLRWHLKQVHNTTLADSDVSYVFEDDTVGKLVNESGLEVGLDHQGKIIKEEVEEEEDGAKCLVITDHGVGSKNVGTISEAHPHNIKSTLKCCICSTYFGSRVELEQHMMNHDNEEVEAAGLHRCDTCGVVMKNTQQISKHILKVHGVENIFGCSICDKEFFQESSVLKHMKFFHKWEMKIRGEGNIPVLLKPASEHLRVPGAGDRDKVRGKVKVDADQVKKSKTDVKVSSRFENDMTFISLEVGELDHLQLYREDGQEVKFEVVSSTDKATIIRIKDPQKDQADGSSTSCPDDDNDQGTVHLKLKESPEVYPEEKIIEDSGKDETNVCVVASHQFVEEGLQSQSEDVHNVLVVSDQSDGCGKTSCQGEEELLANTEDEGTRDAIQDIGSKVSADLTSVSSSKEAVMAENEEEDVNKEKVVVVDIASSPPLVTRVAKTEVKTPGREGIDELIVTATDHDTSSSSSDKSHENCGTVESDDRQVRIVEKHKSGNVPKTDGKEASGYSKIRTISVLDKSPSDSIHNDGKGAGGSPRKRAVVHVEKMETVSCVPTDKLIHGDLSSMKEESSDELSHSQTRMTSSGKDVQIIHQQEGKQTRGRPSNKSSGNDKISKKQSEMDLVMEKQAEVGATQSPKNKWPQSLPKTPSQNSQPSPRSSSGRLIKRKRFADEDETSVIAKPSHSKSRKK